MGAAPEVAFVMAEAEERADKAQREPIEVGGQLLRRLRDNFDVPGA